MSYNPIMDFYDHEAGAQRTQYIDSRDVIYCIRYVGKERRFVYNVSLECDTNGRAQLSVELAGGKVSTRS